jgi:sugar lactone lactonase YvrE
VISAEQEMSLITYDPVQEMFSTASLGSGRTPQITTVNDNEAFLLYSSGSGDYIRRFHNGGFGDAIFTGISNSLSISSINGEPVLFQLVVEDGTRKIKAHGLVASSVFSGERLRRESVRNAQPLPEAYGTMARDFDSHVYMEVLDPQDAEIHRFRSDYGASHCGHMSVDSFDNLYCPKLFVNNVAIMPPGYEEGTDYSNESAVNWGGGWEYFDFPMSIESDHVRGRTYVIDGLSGGGGNNHPSSKLQTWDASKTSESVAWKRSGYPWPTIINSGFRYTPSTRYDFDSAPGTQNGNFLNDMALDQDRGILYLTESQNNRILRLDVRTANAQLLAPLEVGGVLNFPQGIDVDSAGNLYVVDSGNHLIRKISPDGVLLDSFGGLGRDLGQLYYPFALSVDQSSGTIYVSETYGKRVQAFNSFGDPLIAFNNFEVAGIPIEIDVITGLAAKDGLLSLSMTGKGSNVKKIYQLEMNFNF